VATNPVAGDNVSQGDDHLRLLKSTILATFPNITGAMTLTDAELNAMLTYKAAGDVVQVVNVMSAAVATGTTVMVADDTIPQNTEGDEYMTLAITPTNASNKLKIEVVVSISNSNASSTLGMAALFQDSTAGALAAMWSARVAGAGLPSLVTFTHYMAAGTISATTFKARAGFADAGTTTFNGSIGGRYFGGVMASSITITEIEV